jgi:Metallo-beta-lactamase superfamily
VQRIPVPPDQARAAEDANHRPWRPSSLLQLTGTRRPVDVTTLSYLVVEEVLRPEGVGLSVAHWPLADANGSLWFPDDAPTTVGVNERMLHTYLSRHRVVVGARAARDRRLRVGDTFAASVRWPEEGAPWPQRLEEWLEPPVYDVTVEARKVAKLAYYAGVAAVWPHDQATRHHLTVDGAVRGQGGQSAYPRALRTSDVIPLTALGPPSSFVPACMAAPDALVYLLVNVGDGDTQLLLLPKEEAAGRRAVVVDVATVGKLPRLLEALIGHGLLAKGPGMLPVVVATHPHADHIGGIPQLIDRYGTSIREVWESGYLHPNSAYIETMRRLERHRADFSVLQPTSGTTRFLDKVKLTALSPGIGLRSRYDTYGIQVNDASIALRVEFPAARVSQRDLTRGGERDYLRLRDPWRLILGADAQMTSWAQATVDFPELQSRKDHEALFLGAAVGGDALRGHVLKVPHHASKHGLNIELVERIQPRLSLVSCGPEGGTYGFPHQLAVEAIREALRPTVTTGAGRPPDHTLGIHYTYTRDSAGAALGSIAIMVPATRGSPLRLWRFGDDPRDDLDLDNGREFPLPPPPRRRRG